MWGLSFVSTKVFVETGQCDCTMIYQGEGVGGVMHSPTKGYRSGSNNNGVFRYNLLVYSGLAIGKN